MPREHTFLTDEQLAAIAWADAAMTTAAIARQIAADYYTVAAARRRIQRAGAWSCPITWRDCDVCHRPLASGPRPHDRQRHAACVSAWRNDYARQRRRDRAPGSLSTPHVARYRQEHPEAARANRDRFAARKAERWDELPESERAALLAKAHAADARDAAITRASADALHDPWTPEDDAAIIATLDQPARDVAIQLGRTLHAVRARRVRLRKEGQAPPPRRGKDRWPDNPLPE